MFRGSNRVDSAANACVAQAQPLRRAPYLIALATDDDLNFAKDETSDQAQRR